MATTCSTNGRRFFSMQSAIRFSGCERSAVAGLHQHLSRGLQRPALRLIAAFIGTRNPAEHLSGFRRSVLEMIPCDQLDPIATNELAYSFLYGTSTPLCANQQFLPWSDARNVLHKPLRWHSDRAVVQPTLHSGTQVRLTSKLSVRLSKIGTLFLVEDRSTP
jgi:hypothetical protein